MIIENIPNKFVKKLLSNFPARKKNDANKVENNFLKKKKWCWLSKNISQVIMELMDNLGRIS